MVRRVQFARSVVTGNIPADLQPGTPAFNLTDGKVFVGDIGGNARLISQMIEDWDRQRVYREGDFVVFRDNLYRAEQDIPVNVGFRPSEWLQLTDVAGQQGALNTENSVISGGRAVRASATAASISAGSGIIVDRTVSPPLLTVVEWGDFEVGFSLSGSSGRAEFFLYMDENGSAIFTDDEEYIARRAGIVLAQGTADRQSGDLMTMFDARWYVGRSVDFASDAMSGEVTSSIARGCQLSPNSDLTFSIAAGLLYTHQVEDSGPNENRQSFPGQDPVNFTGIYFNRANALLNQTSVPVDRYDNGGVYTQIPANQSTIHLVTIDRAGNVYLEIGQQLYANIGAALGAIEEYADGVGAMARRRLAPGVVVGAIIVTPECTDLSDEATARVMSARSGRDFFNQTNEDLSSFFLLDGSRPLTGPLNAAGQPVRNAILDGNNGTRFLINDVDQTGDTPTGLQENEIRTSLVDQKIYQANALGQPVAIASKTTDFNPLRVYRDGDECYVGTGLYLNRTGANIGPGAFDVADGWTLIGGAAGDVAGAILTQPTTATRNTVDLSGQPNVSGLIIQPDGSQTADIARFGGAVIDRFGMPGGNFGDLVRRIGENTHPFSSVGLAVAFDGTNYILADASDTSTSGKAIGLARMSIDANNFVLQVGGTMFGMEPTAFVGGAAAMVQGQAYFVSSTNPGMLTATAPALPNRVDPICILTEVTGSGSARRATGVIALTSTTGIDVIGGGQTFFEVSQSSHGFSVIGQPVYFDGSIWRAARAQAGTEGIGVVQSITDANNFVVNVGGLITNLSPSAFEGDVAPTAGSTYFVSGAQAGRLTEAEPGNFDIRNPLVLALSATTGVVLPYEPRQNAVETVGEQEIQGPLRVAGDITFGGITNEDHALDPLSQGNLIFRVANTGTSDPNLASNTLQTVPGAAGVRFFFNVANQPVGQLQVDLYDDGSANNDGSLARIARSFFDHRGATDLPSNESVVTRTRGDARYLRQTGGNLSGDLIVEDTLTITGSQIQIDRTGRSTDALIDLRTDVGEQAQIRVWDHSGSGQYRSIVRVNTTGNVIFGSDDWGDGTQFLEGDFQATETITLRPFTGVFSSAYSQLVGSSHTGANTWLINSDGGFRAGRGSAGQPGLSFFSDSASGIFSHPNNDLGLSRRGQENLRITSTGIAIAEPGDIANPTSGYALDVLGAAQFREIRINRLGNFGNPVFTARRDDNGDNLNIVLGSSVNTINSEGAPLRLATVGQNRLSIAPNNVDVLLVETAQIIHLQDAFFDSDIAWGGSQSAPEHWITNNDGGGNANVRFGHRYDNGDILTQDGGSGVHLRAQVDSSDSLLEVRLLEGGASAGDALNVVQTFRFSNGAADPNDVMRRSEVESAAFAGPGQTWQDVTSSRAAGTTYQNTTGRAIQVYVRVNSGNTFEISADNSAFVSFQIPGANATFTVPNGHYYRVIGGLFQWNELR